MNRDCFVRNGFDNRMFMCGLADSEEYSQNSSNYDPLTYFKCMLLLNSNKVGEEIDYDYYDYGDYCDYGDYGDYGNYCDYDDYSDYDEYGDYDDYGDYSDNNDDYYYYYYYTDYNDESDLKSKSLYRYVYESDVRDYFQLATEICYLGKVLIQLYFKACGCCMNYVETVDSPASAKFQYYDNM